MKYSLLGILLASTLCFCSNPSVNRAREILPLHPFRTLEDYKDGNGEFISRSILDYFVVYGSLSDTSTLRRDLLQFASKHFDTNQIKKPVYYEIRFYKQSGRTNKEFKESDHDAIDFHFEDYIATVKYYEDGNHSVRFVR